MSKVPGVLLALSSLSLAACSSVSVESQARLPQPVATFSGTLVVVALPDAVRRVTEDTLVARLPSLRPSVSYPTVSLGGSITLGALCARARKDGFDGLLVVWPVDMTSKTYPSLLGDTSFEVIASKQIGMRLVASLTALGDDREVWKGVVTNRDAAPLVEGAPKMAAALADRLVADGVAN